MKKLLLIALLIVGCVFAKEKKKSVFDGFSISLGFNSSQITGNLEDKIFIEGLEENAKLGFVYGWQKTLKNNWQVEIGIITRGAYYGYGKNMSVHKSSIQLNYIKFNLSKPYTLFKFQFPYQKSKSKIIFPIKLELAFFVDGESKYKKNTFNIFNNENISTSSKLNASKFDFGFPIGFELEYGEKLSICVDYYFGLIDIFDDVESKNNSMQYYLRYKLS